METGQSANEAAGDVAFYSYIREIIKGGDMELKRGTRFLHTKFITEDKKPLECVVTRIARGIVYWRAVEGGSSYCFSLEEAPKYVKEVL